MAVADIQDRFDALYKHMSEKPKDVRNGGLPRRMKSPTLNPGAKLPTHCCLRTGLGRGEHGREVGSRRDCRLE